MLHVVHPLNIAAFSIFAAKKCCKNTAAKSNQFDFAAAFLQHFLKHDLLVAHVCNKYLQKILCLLYNNMSSQEEHITDKEKFKLIECYKENSKLWVTQGDNKKPKSAEKRGTSGGV